MFKSLQHLSFLIFQPIPAMSNDNLIHQALQAAYSGNWSSAIKLNQQIIHQNPDDLEALNRLAKAFLETDQPQKAHRIYQQVLKRDQYNTIAQKNLKRLDHYTQNPSANHTTVHYPAVSFIEEPGISKTIQLTCQGEPSILAKADAGDPVNLIAHKRHICVTTEQKIHLGRIPEDLSLRLINLIRGGNQYQAWIKSIDNQSVKIFIKEIRRASQFKDIPSFLNSNQISYLAFTDPSSVYEDRPDTTSIDEEE